MAPDEAQSLGCCALLKVNLRMSQVAHQAGVYLQFLKHKATRSISTRTGWDASPSQGYPKHYIFRYSIIHVHLGGKRRNESKMSCLTTQHMSKARVGTCTL